MIEKRIIILRNFINRESTISRNADFSASEFKRRFCVNATQQNVILLLKPNNLHR